MRITHTFRKAIQTYTHHSLFKNSAVYMSVNIINTAIPILLLPILTRFLTPADYGIVALYQVIQSVVGVLVGLNTHGVVTTNFFRMKREELRVYIGNLFIILGLSSAFTLIILLFIKSWLANIIGFPAGWFLVILIAAAFRYFTTVNLILWQSEQRPFPYGIFQIASTITNVGMSILLVVVLRMEWEGRLLGIIITMIIFGTVSIYFLFSRGYVRFRINKQHIKDALAFGLPLIPHAIAGLVITATDRIFISAMVDVSATGLYSVGYQIAMIIELLAVSFNSAWVPFLFQKLTENNPATKRAIVKLTYGYFFIILLLALLVAFAAPLFLSVFVGPDFQNSSQYVFWIALGYAASGMYYMVTNYIFYVKKTYILAWVTFGSALLNIILNYFLIKSNGAIGAAQATMISFFVTFIAVWILSARVYHMPWKLWQRDVPSQA